MWAYQARQVRTWYWSSPASFLACWKHSSICQRLPAAQARSAVLDGGARSRRSRRSRRVAAATGGPAASARGRASSRAGPGSGPSRYSRGPCAPAPAEIFCQARAGTRGDQRVGPPLTFGHGQRVAAPDRHHVPDVLVLQPGLQPLGLPVGLIGGEPGERHPRRDRPGDHLLRLPRLGRELRLLRDARRPAPLRVLGPGLRQVQLPVDQRVPDREAYARNTPTWQFSVRPAVPEYCRCTPADRVPFFKNPVSSAISTPSGSPSCSTT